MLVKFKCLKCNYKWEDKAGPTRCPVCDHLYIKWENYEKMRKKWNKDGFVC